MHVEHVEAPRARAPAEGAHLHARRAAEPSREHHDVRVGRRARSGNDCCTTKPARGLRDGVGHGVKTLRSSKETVCGALVAVPEAYAARADRLCREPAGPRSCRSSRTVQAVGSVVPPSQTFARIVVVPGAADLRGRTLTAAPGVTAPGHQRLVHQGHVGRRRPL